MAASEVDADNRAGPSRPRFEDIDVFGVTHPGKVRKDNQDHFFVGSLTLGVLEDSSSLSFDGRPLAEPERLASLAIVADGVGSGGGGEEAARQAVEAIGRQVVQRFHEAYAAEANDPDAFARLLSDAALACHESLVERAEQDPGSKRFATTFTLFLGLWPHAYLLQLGDSRCYLFQDGQLTQISRDQTMAQELVDQGVLTQTRAHSTRWAHVLSSAIGGRQVAPMVTRIVRNWGSVVLLCSDGLTKHVRDEQIGERLAALTSSRQVCEDLLQEALDDGGSDNITLIVGRTIKPATS